MFAEIRHTREMLASFQQLDYYDDLMAQYSSMEAKSEAGDSENFSLKDYAHQYTQMRDTYLQAAKALKMASGPYKASRDAYVAAGACLASPWASMWRMYGACVRALQGERDQECQMPAERMISNEDWSGGTWVWSYVFLLGTAFAR